MTVHLPDRYSFGECPGCEWSVTIGREANLEPASSRPPISGGGPMHSKAVTAQCAPLGGVSQFKCLKPATMPVLLGSPILRPIYKGFS
jgi:hypothetical protein